jgi:hypothetical protein
MDKMLKQPVTAQSAETEQICFMLGVIGSQIAAALQETNAPAATLVETAHALSKATETVARCVFDFGGKPTRVFQDLMVLHDEMHVRATKATTAVQFHDRLVQCLTNVCGTLTYLSEFLSSGSTSKSVAEWEMLRERVRGIHSMEQERVLFDLLSSGASAEAKQSAVSGHQGGVVAGKVELF